MHGFPAANVDLVVAMRSLEDDGTLVRPQTSFVVLNENALSDVQLGERLSRAVVEIFGLSALTSTSLFHLLNLLTRNWWHGWHVRTHRLVV